jgi:hypothetical protein
MAHGVESGRAFMGKRVTGGDLILTCAMKRARPEGKDHFFSFLWVQQLFGCFLHLPVQGKNKGNFLVVLEKTYGSLYVAENFKVPY